MPNVVEIDNLSKKYLIPRERKSAYLTLVDTLREKAGRWKRALVGPRSPKLRQSQYDELWSLRDVTTVIEQGDRVGIIGQNGAGKSTLLKILSRITEPTSGTVRIVGRVSSLLEVGTGFHPELTGRENIYLNGAILGMPYREIKQKFDEIVAFAEIEKFLESPVKQYSSGMYTRLGFAIAAHLDPDLLIIDEALAVGDIKFQDKCLKKLSDLSTHGRTVMYVSHDVGSILALCNRGLYLERGRLKMSGAIDQCVHAYMQAVRLRSMVWEGDEGDTHIRFYRVSLEGGHEQRDFYFQGDQATVKIEYAVFHPHLAFVLGIGLWNQRNQQLGSSHIFLKDDAPRERVGSFPEKRQAVFTLDTAMLHEGEYSLKIECQLYDKKKVLTDQIALKLQIYLEESASAAFAPLSKDVCFLGNQWKHD